MDYGRELFGDSGHQIRGVRHGDIYGHGPRALSVARLEESHHVSEQEQAGYGGGLS